MLSNQFGGCVQSTSVSKPTTKALYSSHTKTHYVRRNLLNDAEVSTSSAHLVSTRNNVAAPSAPTLSKLKHLCQQGDQEGAVGKHAPRYSPGM